MVGEQVDAERLETPLDLTPPKNDDVENEVVKIILKDMYNAKSPMILADVLTARFHSTPEVRQLVDITHFPVHIPAHSMLISVLHDKPRQGNPK